MKEYGKVAVIMGGDTTEREISLISGNAVLQSLIKSGVNAYAFDPLYEPLENLKHNGFDKAVVMIHGKYGEDGKLQGALECLRVPYTGSGVMASSIGMDKYRTKLIWQSVGIPLAQSQYLTKSRFLAHDFKLTIDLPLVVKPVDDGSTLGLTKVYALEDLERAIHYAFLNSTHILLEEMVIGDEYTIIVAEGKVYPIIKIEAPQGEYDYQNKYFTDETKYICPYDLLELTPKINQYALDGFNSIGASGVTRLDFMIDKQQQVYFLEINTIPGMTPHSLVPMSMATVGIDFDKLCLMILDGAGLGK